MGKDLKLGLKKAYYSKITYGSGGSVTYGTPKALPGAVNLNLTPKGDQTDFYADDGLYFSSIVNMGYSGSLELASLTEDFRKDILGDTVDSVTGVLVEDANAQLAHFALLCEITNDAKARRVVFYDCVAVRPASGAQTKGSSANVQTETLNITVAPRADGVVKAVTDDATPTATYNSWYDAVVVPGVPVVTT